MMNLRYKIQMALKKVRSKYNNTLIFNRASLQSPNSGAQKILTMLFKSFLPSRFLMGSRKPIESPTATIWVMCLTWTQTPTPKEAHLIVGWFSQKWAHQSSPISETWPNTKSTRGKARKEQSRSLKNRQENKEGRHYKTARVLLDYNLLIWLTLTWPLSLTTQTACPTVTKELLELTDLLKMAWDIH